MGHITLVGNNMADLLEHVHKLGVDQKALDLRPTVGVVMGSDSDLPTVKPGLQILKSFQIPFEGGL